MCGIASKIGGEYNLGIKFTQRAVKLLHHRGPDDCGVYNDADIALAHTRLSILELSEAGHQPFFSASGRYVMVFNGEIYNHLSLREKYLPSFPFKGHSDTETIIELFALIKEQMLYEMVGMWALVIWDKQEKKAFISRDRYGQKPLYIKQAEHGWEMASEIKVLLDETTTSIYNPTAVVEFLALGNYEHLGANTFFKNIFHFPQGEYAWTKAGDKEIKSVKYWSLPFVEEKDKLPFEEVKKELHDVIVEGILSQTLADVPIGITLSGGIDSSIIAGVLATYYDKPIHVFTAQTPNSKYDETRYVDAVLKKYDKTKFIVHSKNLNELSLKSDVEKYIGIQEEPFGDPSIIAHGTLMSMAADMNIKVILNGQGADEIFFGYNNMAQAILSHQLKSVHFKLFYNNIQAMRLGKKYVIRTFLQTFFPGLEYNFRKESRSKRRAFILPEVLSKVDNNQIKLYDYNKVYNVLQESILGVHLPHLVHYDDRNGMSVSIEGRMPFLDHRIAACVAKINTNDFLKNGLRKYPLREACKQYLPDEIYNRTDKIGFHTPLINAIKDDKEWILQNLAEDIFLNKDALNKIITEVNAGNMGINEALIIWRIVSLNIHRSIYNVNA